MVSTRTVAAAGLTAALALIPTAAASAAPTVSVRVEGAKSTLLAPRTITAPSSGSVTKGGTPAGTCPAASAAGALDRATRGRWGGTYSSGLGVQVNSILGTTLSYSRGSYWGFYVDDRYASLGVCATKLRPGTELLFAAIPAKGRVPRPIVLRAPARVGAGEPFDVRAYEYTGRGSATRPVTGARLTVTRSGHGVGATVGRPMTSVKGVSRISVPKAGRVQIVASAAGAIRSAPAAVTVR